MSTVKIVSVVINFDMYVRFFTDNPNVNTFDLLPIDNRGINRGLPTIYNEQIVAHLADDCWLFFVHEDFEVRGGMSGIADLNREAVYGTFGINFEHNAPLAYGKHVCSNKDGSNAVTVGMDITAPIMTQTLDCQSVLVHTSLLAKLHGLRFDEALTFDLYAEDFCINARLRHGVPTYVFPLDFQHYSHGHLTQRYFDGLTYLAKKYPDIAVPGSCSFIGGRSHDLEKLFTYQVQADPKTRTRWSRLVRLAKRLLASRLPGR